MRTFTDVRVAGRDRGRADALATRLVEAGLPVRSVDPWPAAPDGADVVCAATSTSEPIVRQEWLGAGTHVTSVGYTAGGREVDDATVADALVVVESRDTAVAPFPVGTDDVAGPVSRGLLAAGDLVEIGELVEGWHPGRTSPAQLTLYKSVGVAVQDAAAAGMRAVAVDGPVDRGRRPRGHFAPHEGSQPCPGASRAATPRPARAS